MPQDVAFNFHQRVHWTCFLLKHYKAYTDRFMSLVAPEAYAARIWSVLSRERSFRSWWQSLSDAEKAKRLYEAPYSGMTTAIKKRYIHCPILPGLLYQRARESGRIWIRNHHCPQAHLPMRSKPSPTRTVLRQSAGPLLP